MQSDANSLARIESDWKLRDGVNSLISNISCTKQSNLFRHFFRTKNCFSRSFGTIHTNTLTIMPDTTSAATFLQVLNNCHSSVKFTMETENNGMLPFLGMQLLNRAPQIETKVYIKPTNTGLLHHYQSHVDMHYKRGLLKTMLDHAYRLSSCWSYFSEECDRLRVIFSRLKYPQHLINTTIKIFVASKAEDQLQIPAPGDSPAVGIVLPFKDQVSADFVRKQLKDLSQTTHTAIQPVFVSNKIEQELKVQEKKNRLL